MSVVIGFTDTAFTDFSPYQQPDTILISQLDVTGLVHRHSTVTVKMSRSSLLVFLSSSLYTLYA